MYGETVIFSMTNLKIRNNAGRNKVEIKLRSQETKLIILDVVDKYKDCGYKSSMSF